MTGSSRVILAQTPDGHALLDPFATLMDGIPRELWQLVCHQLLPSRPFSISSSACEHRPKRRRLEITAQETANIFHHDQLVTWLEKAIEDTRRAWLAKEPKLWYQHMIRLDDSAVIAAQSLADWVDTTAELNVILEGSIPLTPVVLHLDHICALGMSSLFHVVHINESQACVELRTSSAEYLLPPRSGFLMSDMKQWKSILRRTNLPLPVNFVILDPPWPSASVRRSSSYRDIDIYDLFTIDLPSILANLSPSPLPVLVSVWVTNHPKYRKFVREKLLPDWKVEGIADWYWVKVTSNTKAEEANSGGFPIWDLNGASPRRCYEGLILGYYNPQKAVLPELPDQRAFLSVPMEHSRKPLVTELVRPFLSPSSDDVGVLELFARFTPSGRRGAGQGGFWLSVGNEALKYNEVGRHLAKDPR